MSIQTFSDWSIPLATRLWLADCSRADFFPLRTRLVNGCASKQRLANLIGRTRRGVSIWLVEPVGAFHSDWLTTDARCPGKMASEEQCSAPPRWRSISLTHVEYPAGKSIFKSLFSPQSRSYHHTTLYSRRGGCGTSRSWMDTARAGLPNSALRSARNGTPAAK